MSFKFITILSIALVVGNIGCREHAKTYPPAILDTRTSAIKGENSDPKDPQEPRPVPQHPPSAPPGPGKPPPSNNTDENTCYNQVQQVSSHNSYDSNGPKRGIDAQLGAGVRSFEFDLHIGDEHSNWDVYHTTHVFSGGDFCDNLRACLEKFRNFHNKQPDHEVITIWLELKDDWKTGGHRPIDLDNGRLDHDLPGLIYRPQTLLARANGAQTLQDAVLSTGWPTLSSLRGKFIIVLMGDDEAAKEYILDVNGYQNGAIGNNGYQGQKNCFVAPENDLLSKVRPGIWKNAVFFNAHNTDGLHIPRGIFEAGFVSRIWKIDDQDEWNDALKSKAQHIATDHVTQEFFSPRRLLSFRALASPPAEPARCPCCRTGQVACNGTCVAPPCCAAGEVQCNGRCMPPHGLCAAEFFTHTNNDNKDHDTCVFVRVETRVEHALLAEAVSADCPDVEYGDQTEHAINLQTQTHNLTKEQMSDAVVRVRQKTHGNDTWKFDARVTLRFADGSSVSMPRAA